MNFKHKYKITTKDVFMTRLEDAVWDEKIGKKYTLKVEEYE